MRFLLSLVVIHGASPVTTTDTPPLDYSSSSSVFNLVSIDPGPTCLMTSVHGRLRERSRRHRWRHHDWRPACRRKPERCETVMCRIEEAAFLKADKSLNAVGKRLRPPECIDVAPGSVISGFFSWCDRSAKYRAAEDVCSTVVIIREPVKRLVLDYRLRCIKNDEGFCDETFLGWARNQPSNHYTRLFAHHEHHGSRGASTARVIQPSRNVTRHEFHRAQAFLSKVSVLLVDIPPVEGKPLDLEVPATTWPLLAALLHDYTGITEAAPGEGVDAAECLEYRRPTGGSTDSYNDGNDNRRHEHLFVPTAAEVREVYSMNYLDVHLYKGLLEAARLSSSSLLSPLPSPPSSSSSPYHIKEGASSSPGTANPPNASQSSTGAAGGNEVKAQSSTPIPIGSSEPAASAGAMASSFIDTKALRTLLIAAAAICLALLGVQSCVVSGPCLMRCFVMCVRRSCRLVQRFRACLRRCRIGHYYYYYCDIIGRLLAPLRRVVHRCCCCYRRVPEDDESTGWEMPADSQPPSLSRMLFDSYSGDGRQLNRRGASKAKAKAFFASERERAANDDFKDDDNDDDDDDDDDDSSTMASRTDDAVHRYADEGSARETKASELTVFLAHAKLSKHEHWLRAAGFAEVLDLQEADDEDFAAAQREFLRNARSEPNTSPVAGQDGLMMKKTESRRLRRALLARMEKPEQQQEQQEQHEQQQGQQPQQQQQQKMEPSEENPPASRFHSSTLAVEADTKSAVVPVAVDRLVTGQNDGHRQMLNSVRFQGDFKVDLDEDYVEEEDHFGRQRLQHPAATAPPAHIISPEYNALPIVNKPRPVQQSHSAEARAARAQAIEEVRRERESTPWSQYQGVLSSKPAAGPSGSGFRGAGMMTKSSSSSSSNNAGLASRRSGARKVMPSDERQRQFQQPPLGGPEQATPAKSSPLDSSFISSSITAAAAALGKANRLTRDMSRADTVSADGASHSKSSSANLDRYDNDNDPLLARARELLADYHPDT